MIEKIRLHIRNQRPQNNYLALSGCQKNKFENYDFFEKVRKFQYFEENAPAEEIEECEKYLAITSLIYMRTI